MISANIFSPFYCYYLVASEMSPGHKQEAKPGTYPSIVLLYYGQNYILTTIGAITVLHQDCLQDAFHKKGEGR